MQPTRASDVMRRHVITLAPDDSLAAAAQMMRLGRIRQLPVVQEDRIVGELSYRDACAAFQDLIDDTVNLEGEWRRALKTARDLPVEKIMGPAGEQVHPNDALDRVAHCIARRGTGFVPVVAAETQTSRILGVVTERDLLRSAVTVERR